MCAESAAYGVYLAWVAFAVAAHVATYRRLEEHERNCCRQLARRAIDEAACSHGISAGGIRQRRRFVSAYRS
jgi:hypothetical protein